MMSDEDEEEPPSDPEEKEEEEEKEEHSVLKGARSPTGTESESGDDKPADKGSEEEEVEIIEHTGEKNGVSILLRSRLVILRPRPNWCHTPLVLPPWGLVLPPPPPLTHTRRSRDDYRGNSTYHHPLWSLGI
ncbi:unnamed protein product [Linum trigynum]|uniref:Uncharacterized protein n=1 Tax=Linum trigynum TaxID=586398 RepID=A0AAV2ESS5_9ROSI